MFGVVPQTGSRRTLAPHPACGHLPPRGKAPRRAAFPRRGKAFAYDKKGVTQLNTEKVISRDNDYILHTYGRSQVVLAEGEGMTARDADGKSYLDFTSGIGVNSLGYCHPAWVRAVADQAATLQHTSNLYYTAPDGKLAKKLCRRTGLDAVFFGNSGAEANEGAIKCARKYSVDTYGESRNKVITLVNSFHGRTLATLTATGQDVFHHDFGPFPGNFDYVPAGNFAALEKAADKDTCAVMMELVQGEGGVVALDADYVARVAAFCREKDILVIVDEVQTGVGRTGTFLCCEHYNLKPDIVTLAKGLGGGLPIGAVLMNEKVAEGMGPGTHGSTFGANPVSTAAGGAVMAKLDDAFLKEVQEKGQYLRTSIENLGSPWLGGVVGMGLMLGVDVKEGHTNKELATLLLDNGLLCLTAGERLRLLPPLVITKDEMDKGLAIMKQTLHD